MNIILVDTSYTTFYRFFATMRWLSLAKKEIYKEHKADPSYDWSDNEIFMEKYKKMYLEGIKKLVKRKLFDSSILIFCKDCPQADIWRNELYCEYKGNRPDLTKKHNYKPVFKYTYETLLPDIVNDDNKRYIIQEPSIESDDIIALCVKYLKKNHKNANMNIISGDKDFYQLGSKNVSIYDYRKKEPLNFTKEEALNELKLKIINGDCSDNIPSIFPKELKISNKRKKQIREDDNILLEYLDEYPKANEIYQKNKLLIDFNEIPKKFHQKVFSKIKVIIDNIYT
uniref:5'-3' exonuclease-like protein n=1 Tax=Megaviridae environmental sample TaxID=1737588 RepID=A0A5J6VKC0_9VIRU|nr:MAG: 5'-3' exonuclease-like protein [Megaviridae environmental sample]